MKEKKFENFVRSASFFTPHTILILRSITQIGERSWKTYLTYSWAHLSIFLRPSNRSQFEAEANFHEPQRIYLMRKKIIDWSTFAHPICIVLFIFPAKFAREARILVKHALSNGDRYGKLPRRLRGKQTL